MTARITSRQKEQYKKLVGDALTSIDPSKDDAQRVLGLKEFSVRFKELYLELSGQFYLLLTDDEAVVWIVKHTDKSETEARQIVEGLRKEARRRKVADTVKLHAEVLAGCLFKRDMPKMGSCWEDFRYLQGWDFADPPTEHALVSWIPVPLPDSTRQNVTEQTATVAAWKAEADLPEWYELSFGSVNHVSGLALAHRKATGSDPFNGLVVRTDTCSADGDRLNLYWGGGRLDCGHWDWGDGGRLSVLAVFALGVVKALGR